MIIIYIMSVDIDFSYNKFYEYYTDRNTKNYYTEPNRRSVKIYFYKNNKHNREPVESKTSTNFIIINDVKVYVTPYENDKNKELLFTIPTEYNGQLYDYHYHFGIRELNNKEIQSEIDEFFIINSSRSNSSNSNSSNSNSSNSNSSNSNSSNSNSSNSNSSNSRKTIQPIKTKKTIKNKKSKISTAVMNESTESPLEEINKLNLIKKKMNSNEKVVFFHKTIQIPDSSSNLVLPEGKNSHIECYFQNNVKIETIKNIICMNESGKLMKNQFTDEELSFIDEIIRRPFNIGKKEKSNPRNKRKTIHNRRKKSRKIYTEKKESDTEKYEKIFEKSQIII
jgi:hypothetical protein